MPSPEPGAAVDRALRLGVVGVHGDDHDDDRWSRRLDRFAAVTEGSFVWTRDIDGELHLGRIDGALRHDPEGAAVDLQHVRDCRWLPDPVDPAIVPDAVQHTFARGGQNFQRTHPGDVERLTAGVWDRLS